MRITSIYFTINHKQMSIKAIIRKDSESEITQSCPTLCNPMECGLPGSSVHGILQTRVMKWVPFPSPGDLPTQGLNLGLSHCGQMFYHLTQQWNLGKAKSWLWKDQCYDENWYFGVPPRESESGVLLLFPQGFFLPFPAPPEPRCLSKEESHDVLHV